MDGTNAQSTEGYITISGDSSTQSGLSWNTNVISYGELVSFSAKAASGISPQLYFKYIKRKFGTIERMKLDSRLKKLEKAFLKAADNGQEMLGDKIMKDLARETRESAMYAKGVKHFIEHSDLHKYKNSIRGGHISDTKLADFTRVIPNDVLAKKKKVEDLFDGFVIYHYYNEKVETERAKKQKMSPEEKSRMRDPVLFGVIRESNRLYFIADWEDEFCDLTFEEMVDVIGKDEDDMTIPREPVIG